MGRIKDTIYKSPAAKTAISVLTALGTGFFSNTLVSEMTVEGKIVWTSYHETTSFYALLVFVILAFWFHKNLHSYEKDISNFKDTDFCEAYARSHLIPAQVAAFKEKIANGQTADLDEAMKQLKRILK